MKEGNSSEGEGRVPAQQAQQPQPSKALNDNIHSPVVQAVTEKTAIISETAEKKSLTQDKGSDGEAKNPGAAVDDARFTAGVVRLYEALLKEPIPEEMLRLVDRLGKQERK